MAVIQPTLHLDRKMRIEDCPPYITRARENKYSIVDLCSIHGDMRDNNLAQRCVYQTNVDLNYKNKQTYIIDNLIKADVPDQNFLTIQRHIWKREKNWYLSISILSGIVTACGFVGAVKKRAEHPVAVAIGVASLAGAIFTAYTIFRWNDASNQVKGWEKDPCEKIAQARSQAYKSGFRFVKQHNLRLIDPSNHAILLQEEVEYLYESYFNSFCESLLDGKAVVGDAAQHQWLNDFTRDNPVARDVLEYAYRQVPDKFAQVSSDYEALHAQLSHLRDQFTQMRTQRRQETQNIMDDIERNRRAALLPLKLIYDGFVEEAGQEQNRKLSGANLERTAQIIHEYEMKVQKYKNYLRMASAPVHHYFDGQLANARRELKTILAQIDRSESAAHAPYFNYSKGLLEYARNLITQPMFEYVQQPLPQNAYNIPAVQQPSAPPAEHLFAEQAAVRPDGMSEAEYQQYLEFIQKK